MLWDNTSMDKIRRKKRTLKSLYYNAIFSIKGFIKNASNIQKIKRTIKAGHVPSRGDEDYKYCTKSGYLASDIVNCLGHAVFNFSNAELDDMKLDKEAGRIFCDIESKKGGDTIEGITEGVIDLVKKTGLKIEPAKPEAMLKSNQWKIALYFGQLEDSTLVFHFFFQEEPNHWTSKMAHQKHITHYDHLDDIYVDKDATYEKYEEYIITNPYAE